MRLDLPIRGVYRNGGGNIGCKRFTRGQCNFQGGARCIAPPVYAPMNDRTSSVYFTG